MHLTVAVAITLVGLGCGSSDGPSGIDGGDAAAATDGPPGDGADSAAADGLPVVTDGGGTDADGGGPSGSKVIGAAGGEHTGAGLQLLIPAGALATDVAFSISVVTTGYPALPATEGPVSAVFAIEPHAQSFAKPITLTIAHQGGTAESILLLAALPTGSWSALAGSTIDASNIKQSTSRLGFFVVSRRAKADALWPMVFRKWKCTAANRPELSFEVVKRTPFGADADWVDLTSLNKLPASATDNLLTLKKDDGGTLMKFSRLPSTGTLTGLSELAETAAGKVAYGCTAL